MMTTRIPVNEPGETRLDEPAGSLEALAAAGTDPDQLTAVAGRYPACLAAWAALGEAALAAGRPVDAYAYFRVGYHRGLDRLRRAGWRGSGQVPWSHEPNRGFLLSLAGLAQAAGMIGETDEADRCATFLAELAPDAPGAAGAR
jgi:hypothetical protein